MPTLLTYSLSTDPSPLQASPSADALEVATLTLLATNLTKASILLKGISVRLPVGSGAAQLTENAGLIGVVLPEGWVLHNTQKPPGAVVYVFYPPAGQPTLAAGAPLAFAFNNVRPNTAVGIVPVLVTEGSADSASQTIELPKYPPRWRTVTFGSTPIDVRLGDAVTLKWDGGPTQATYRLRYHDFASDKTVELPADGQPPFRNAGAYPAPSDKPLILQQSTTFTLLVTAMVGGREVTAQPQTTVVVLVPPPRILEFRAEPGVAPLGPPWPNVRLSWKTEKASSLRIDGVDNFDDAQQVAEGTTLVGPEANHQYIATAKGLPGSTAEASAKTGVIFTQSYTIKGYVPLELRPWAAGDIQRTLLQFARLRPNPLPKPKDSRFTMELGWVLAPGFTGAEMPRGAAAPVFGQPSYNEIRNLPYSAVMEIKYAEMDCVGNEDSVVPYNARTAPFQLWQRWGIRTPEGIYGLLWLESVSDASYQVPTLTFGWTLYKGYAQPQPDDADTALTNSN